MIFTSLLLEMAAVFLLVFSVLPFMVSCWVLFSCNCTIYWTNAFNEETMVIFRRVSIAIKRRDSITFLVRFTMLVYRFLIFLSYNTLFEPRKLYYEIILMQELHIGEYFLSVKVMTYLIHGHDLCFFLHQNRRCRNFFNLYSISGEELHILNDTKLYHVYNTKFKLIWWERKDREHFE